MTFRSTSRQLVGRLGLVAAIAALATSAAVQATPASAAPPDSGLNGQDLGTPGTPGDPHNPGGCGGDCGSVGGCDFPGGVPCPVVKVSLNDWCKVGSANKPECRLFDQVMEAARHGQRLCADLPALGKKCIGPEDVGATPPPLSSPTAVPAPAAKTIKCTGRMLDGTRCPGADGFPPIVLKSLAAQCAQGNANACVNYDKAVGRDTPATPDAAVDCAKTPENANCDPDGHWCYDHPEDPNCAGVTGTWCDEHPDAAECNIDQAQGFAAADNAAADQPADNVAADNGGVDNGADVAPDENAAPDQAADDVGAMDDGGMDAIDDGGGMADGGQ